MTQHDVSDAQSDRAHIDGGMGFALAAFALGLGLLAVLGRIGLRDDLLRIGMVSLIFSGLVVVAIRSRTMRPAEFFAAGSRLPAPYVGLVFSGGIVGLFLPFLPPLPSGAGNSSVTAGFALGALLALFVTGPVLRRSGAYSFAGFIAARFPGFPVRWPAVLVMSACAACVALGGLEIALQSLIATAGVARGAGTAVLGGLLLLLIVPAGSSGVIWVCAAAVIVTIVALALPLGIGLLAGGSLAVPVLGNAALWSRAAAAIASVTGSHSGMDLRIVAAIALGLVSLGPLFAGSVAASNETRAWRAGAAGALWLLLCAILVTATVAASALALNASASGRMPQNLPQQILAASGRGDIAICGTHASDPVTLTFACAAEAGPSERLRIDDFRTSGGYLLENLPVLQGSEPTLARLAAAFAIVLGMGLAASGIQFIVTSFGHDIAHPKRRRRGPITRRLAIARLTALVLIVLASLWLVGHDVDARRLFGLALMLSGALITPLLVLALTPRASSLAAFAALCVAGFVAIHFMHAEAAAVMPPAELASNTIFAALDGLAVGLFVSFLPKRQAPVSSEVVAASPGEDASKSA
ncbi:MAG: hypothetical protein EPN75_00850 [Beijerinckiaceae bacterium]|nr:MAG: hypothetical protein EPN75_00850 [Beijerinckiaceae bacterium]